jgi:hypothetical protein
MALRQSSITMWHTISSANLQRPDETDVEGVEIGLGGEVDVAHHCAHEDQLGEQQEEEPRRLEDVEGTP